jgi:hypothetical protein
MRTAHPFAGRGRDAGLPHLRLTDPVDVLAAVPYLIGFHPADCVVMLALRGKSLAFVARTDLVVPPEPEPGGPEGWGDSEGPGVSAADLDAVAHEMLRGVPPTITGAVLVGYGRADRVEPTILGLERALARRAIRVIEALRCADGRYWSYRCTNLDCCPADGRPFDASASPVAATAIFAGQAALPDRATYEAQVAPVGGLARISMRQATERAGERLVALISRAESEAAAGRIMLREGRAAIEEAIERYAGGGRLDDDEVAWLSLLLVSIPVRDLAWERITGGPEILALHCDLWLDLTRRVEPDLVAAPGSLFAFAAWRAGDGPLARIAVERVLAEDPTYNLATIIAGALDRRLPPSVADGFPYRPARRRPGRRPRRRSSSRRAGSR